MSDSIENLLARSLHDVFGERDPARRTTAIEAIFDRAGTSGIAGWKMRLSPSRRSSRTIRAAGRMTRRAVPVLLDQVLERLLAGNWKDHLPRNALRVADSGFGDAEKNAGLPTHLPIFVKQFLDDTPLGADRDGVRDLQQQLDKAVDDFAFTGGRSRTRAAASGYVLGDDAAPIQLR
jgi:hypothetical protein